MFLMLIIILEVIFIFLVHKGSQLNYYERKILKSFKNKPYFKNTTYYDSFPRSEMPTDGSAPKSDSGWSDQQKNPNSG